MESRSPHIHIVVAVLTLGITGAIRFMAENSMGSHNSSRPQWTRTCFLFFFVPSSLFIRPVARLRDYLVDFSPTVAALPSFRFINCRQPTLARWTSPLYGVGAETVWRHQRAPPSQTIERHGAWNLYNPPPNFFGLAVRLTSSAGVKLVSLGNYFFYGD